MAEQTAPTDVWRETKPGHLWSKEYPDGTRGYVEAVRPGLYGGKLSDPDTLLHVDTADLYAGLNASTNACKAVDDLHTALGKPRLGRRTAQSDPRS